MNVFSRGAKNALRSPLRAGAIVIMLAISVGLLLSMLVARSSITAKINDIKATTATNITITPAGVHGFQGGGNPLTMDQVSIIKNTPHVSSVTASLSDQLGSTDTNLVSPLQLGSLGRRLQRFEARGGNPTTTSPMTPRISVTGTTNPSTTIPSSKLTSGVMINGTSSNDTAIVGTSLASKNNLKVGSTFTAYGTPFTVTGIFDTGNAFQNSGILVPLATLQALTNQPGAVSNVIATVDNSDNVSSTAAALKTSLGDKADIVTQEEQITALLQPLQSISSLALAGVIGAALAGVVIVLMAMITVVRERRREIGIIKAIGGTNAKVVGQFVTEALTLTIIGGVLGLLLGVVVSGPMTQSLVSNSKPTSSISAKTGHVNQGGTAARLRGSRAFGQQVSANFKQIRGAVTPSTLSIGAGIVLLVAIVGSAVPAWFIARIRPAEVLRTE